MNVIIAERLVKLRKKYGMSQEALAEKIGVSRQAVSKWERSESSPDTDNLMALARIYNLTIDDMLYADDEAARHQETIIDSNESIENAQIGNNARVRKAFAKFPYPLLVTIVYLFIGFVWDWWHPGWLIYMTVPIWSAIVGRK